MSFQLCQGRSHVLRRRSPEKGPFVLKGQEEPFVPLPLRANAKIYVSIFMSRSRNNGVPSVLKRVLPSGKFIWQNCSSFHTPPLASLAHLQR